MRCERVRRIIDHFFAHVNRLRLTRTRYIWARKSANVGIASDSFLRITSVCPRRVFELAANAPKLPPHRSYSPIGNRAHLTDLELYMSTSQKVVIVTGASQGIGAETVKAFRKLDYRVVATSRSIKPSDDANILTVAGDIADPETARRVVREAVAR